MKCKHRSELLLKKWSQDGYWCRQNDILKVNDPETFVDTIERIHVNDMTVEEFIEKYERAHKPVIIQGVTDTWPGMKEWQLNVSKLDSFSYQAYRRDSCNDLEIPSLR